MKRTLVLVPVTLVTALIVTSLADGQSVPVRALPKQVTASTLPKRDRTRPYTFTTRGRVVPPPTCAPGAPRRSTCVPLFCPPGTSDPAYCTAPPKALLCKGGKVTVRFKKDGAPYTISSRSVGLRPDCTYRSRVSFRHNSPLRRGTFIVRTRFEGNAFLLPKSARSQKVRAG